MFKYLTTEGRQTHRGGYSIQIKLILSLLVYQIVSTKIHRYYILIGNSNYYIYLY